MDLYPRIAAMRRSYTKNRLMRWGITDDQKCVLCNSGNESHEHLFFTCEYSCFIWDKLLCWQRIRCPAKAWLEVIEWTATNARGKGATSAKFRMILAAAVYHIWKERNCRIFQAQSRAAAMIIRRIVQEYVKIMEHNSQIQIPKVKLGTQGLEVSKLGFGCLGLSGMLNTPLSHEAGCSILKETFNKGITFFDTSDLYGHEGDNEIMVGKALKQLPREQVQLATIFGLLISEDFKCHVKGTPEYVRKCCEESLKRLNVDYIDLYYPHRIDTTVPIEETMEELKKLAEEGKIRYIGLSEASVDTIKRAHAVHPVTAVQIEYSLWTREIEEDVIPLCRELGIGIVAYSPLGRGFFGGKAVTESLPTGSMMGMHPRFNEQNLEKNKVLYSRLANLAAKHGCSPPQLALAWLMHQGDDVVPIPGTTKIKNLNDNIQSLGVKLTPEDLKEISDSVPISEVYGERDYDVISKYDYRFANTPLKN